jgi:hypothetical protein
MNHDIQAAWASSEIAELLMKDQISFFKNWGTQNRWSVYAGREAGREWPIADGVIYADNATHDTVKMAIEYKRQNEGLHGLLTALGQSLAYLEKGYDASIVVIPESYISHQTPGEHIKRIIDSAIGNPPISVYTYKPPNSSAMKPFSGRLHCVRNIVLPDCNSITPRPTGREANSFSTLWAHMREGMSYPDAFFRYCQAAKLVRAGKDISISNSRIPKELRDAVLRISSSYNPVNYLSSTSGDTHSDKVWRSVWFNFYFWEELIPIYTLDKPYCVNSQKTKIRMMDGECQGLFSGRVDSIKEKLVKALNDGDIDEKNAWEKYAKKVHSDAHSYREVIDSGLFHIGFLQPDGTLSELGYKFVDACERINDANNGIPLELLRAAVLINGQYDAFLHYVYQVSEEKFSKNPLAFTETNRNGKISFNKTTYKQWLYKMLADDLHLIKTSTIRAGGTRNPFQSEIPLLKQLGFIKGLPNPSYRIGVGLEIDWPQVQNSLIFGQSL